MGETLWTDVEITALRELHAQKLSASQIGDRIHKSRNAVIGKLSRIGLGANKRPPAPRLMAKPKRIKFTRSDGAAPSKPKPLAAPTKIARTAYGKKCTLIDLASHSCRWPINDGGPFLFCNAERINEFIPYCAEHFRISYRLKENAPHEAGQVGGGPKHGHHET